MSLVSGERKTTNRTRSLVMSEDNGCGCRTLLVARRFIIDGNGGK
ncbi:hypothetical protein L195_g025341, partial [Trifolium pratense]